MPIIRQIIPTRGREFWDSLDPTNMRQVLEAVKEVFERSEPAYQLHYFSSLGDCKVSQPCFHDCQVFLLRGEFFLEGQARVTETGCSYIVKDEVWIGLFGSTTLVVMEEGEQRGACLKNTQELQDKMLAKMQPSKKLKKSTITALCQPWKW